MASWFSSLRKTRERFAGALQSLFSSGRPDPESLDELADMLIMADVNAAGEPCASWNKPPAQGPLSPPPNTS